VRENKRRARLVWLFLAVLVLAAAAGGSYFWLRGSGDNGTLEHIKNVVQGRPAKVRVEVLRPQKGDMDRTTVQPASAHPWEAVQIYAAVSGYLKTQNVDIGSVVKRGDVLAVLEVPNLDKQVERCEAVVEQANARVLQTEARVDSAQADWVAAQSDVAKTQASVNSAQAWSKFRYTQWGRYRGLLLKSSIEAKVVDEAQEHYEAAKESERAAQAAVAHAEAVVLAMRAKIKQAEADVVEAKAEVKVAQAELGKAKVQCRFATIDAPFDGVVTQRNFQPRDFIRAATEGGSGNAPLLTVERTDKLRVVVQVLARDVPYTDIGDPATVEFDSLPGVEYKAVVSRTQRAQDPNTRLMRTEIDVPNPDGKLLPGMFGRATIILERAPNVLSLPNSCLVKANDGKFSVYVVRDSKAWLIPVETGANTGVRVAMLKGLDEKDQVVLRAARGLSNGARVVVTNQPENPSGKKAP
jgi:HlyD family secretion protein